MIQIIAGLLLLTAALQAQPADTLNARFLQMVPILLPSEGISHQLTEWKETGCLGCPDSVLVIVALDVEWDSLTSANARLQTSLWGCQRALVNADSLAQGWANCRSELILTSQAASLMELQIGGLQADTTLLATQLRRCQADTAAGPAVDTTRLALQVRSLVADTTRLGVRVRALQADSLARRQQVQTLKNDTTASHLQIRALAADTLALATKYRNWKTWGLALEAAAQYQHQGWFWGSLMNVPWYLQPPPKPEP